MTARGLLAVQTVLGQCLAPAKCAAPYFIWAIQSTSRSLDRLL